jgi:hypothetical protein
MASWVEHGQLRAGLTCSLVAEVLAHQLELGPLKVRRGAVGVSEHAAHELRRGANPLAPESRQEIAEHEVRANLTRARAAAGPYIAIGAGYYHSLALRADGSLVQWGNSQFAQANNSPSAAGPYTAISAGAYHNLALRGVPTVSASFTYQGRLTGQTGPVDLRFQLFGSATGGGPIGRVSGAFNVFLPSSGVFSATINPGNISFAQSLWLEVAVSPAGEGNYVVLSPRQPITPTPQAIFANQALFADQANTAASAGTVPWSGVTGVPANVVSSPWTAGPGSINYTAGSNTTALKLSFYGKVRVRSVRC